MCVCVCVCVRVWPWAVVKCCLRGCIVGWMPTCVFVDMCIMYHMTTGWLWYIATLSDMICYYVAVLIDTLSFVFVLLNGCWPLASINRCSTVNNNFSLDFAWVKTEVLWCISSPYIIECILLLGGLRLNEMLVVWYYTLHVLLACGYVHALHAGIVRSLVDLSMCVNFCPLVLAGSIKASVLRHIILLELHES